LPEDKNNTQDHFTVVGTNIDEVKRLNSNSGLSYNEVKELLAKTGGKGTAIYSNTNIEEVRQRNLGTIEKE
jgi:hypothetical protein